jgi:hypothetical protein
MSTVKRYIDPQIEQRLLAEMQGTARLRRPGVVSDQHGLDLEGESCSSRQKDVHYREMPSILVIHTDPAKDPLESLVGGFEMGILKMTSLQARRSGTEDARTSAALRMTALLRQACIHTDSCIRSSVGPAR